MIVLRILVASFIAWLSLGSPAEASPLPDAPVVAYTYDAPVYNAPGTASAIERGPPAAGYADTTHDAVDRWSHGPSARSAGVRDQREISPTDGVRWIFLERVSS